MYEPAHFVEDRTEILHGLVRRHPLGLLVCNGEDGPVANAIPFLLDVSSSEKGRLLAHLARANPQWKLIEAGAPVLVVFQGEEAYVTPSWYATKAETGKVVPTWNYCMVQVRGPATVIHDPQWLRSQVEALTDRHEGERPAPWKVSDAPERFTETQLRGIVGIEIAICDISGKWKVSQNRPAADIRGVAAGMAASANPGEQEMARLVAGYLRSEG